MKWFEFIKKNKILYVLFFIINTIFLTTFLTLSSINNKVNIFSTPLINEDAAVLFYEPYNNNNMTIQSVVKNQFPNEYVYFVKFGYYDKWYLNPNEDYEGIKLTKSNYDSILDNSTYNVNFYRYDKGFDLDLSINNELSDKAYNEVSLSYLNKMLNSEGSSSSIKDVNEVAIYFEIGVFINKENETKLLSFIKEYKDNALITYKEEFNDLNLNYYSMLGQSICIIFLCSSIIINIFITCFFYINNKKDFASLYILGKRGLSLYKDYFISYIFNLLLSFIVSFIVYQIVSFATYINSLELNLIKLNLVGAIFALVYIIFAIVMMNTIFFFNGKKKIAYKIKDLS